MLSNMQQLPPNCHSIFLHLNLFRTFQAHSVITRIQGKYLPQTFLTIIKVTVITFLIKVTTISKVPFCVIHSPNINRRWVISRISHIQNTIYLVFLSFHYKRLLSPHLSFLLCRLPIPHLYLILTTKVQISNSQFIMPL